MKLNAGKIRMTYENGFLRYLKAGDTELLRMIYFAVRDPEWNTIPSEILNQQIKIDGDSFVITYDRVFNAGDIQMHWEVLIQGKKNSEIFFEIKGKALHGFLKNRAGLCVLHPIKENAGQEVTIIHPDGSREENIFPVQIAPHQPFLQIAALQWYPLSAAAATLTFAGDIFETEDQRNWTDNSFKTYCTPLDQPMPAMLQEGETVHQSCRFTLNVANIIVHDDVPDYGITYNESDLIPIPPIGLRRSAIGGLHHPEALKILAQTGFSHYRVDVRLSDAHWKENLEEALREGMALNAPLEIGLLLSSNNDKGLQDFLQHEISLRDIKSLILLEEQADCISKSYVEKVLPLFRQRFPNTLIGCGTDKNFAELNRSDLNKGDFDFISYPMHPQAHASDSATLIENTEAQGDTVHTAKRRFGADVHVSAISLNAPDKIDPRQQEQFGAVWTLASLKYLIEAGAASLTYYEAVGENGVCNFETTFISFPVLRIFNELLSGKWTHVIRSKTNDPLVLTPLILTDRKHNKILIARHTNENNELLVIEQENTSL